MRRNPLDISRVADQGTDLTIRNDPGGCQTRRNLGFLLGVSQFKRNMEATGGFEPPNRGFADLLAVPIHYRNQFSANSFSYFIRNVTGEQGLFSLSA